MPDAPLPHATTTTPVTTPAWFAPRVGAVLLLLTLLLASWLPLACAYPGYSRGHLRERPIAHPPPSEQQHQQESGAARRNQTDTDSTRTGGPPRRESISRTIPNEPGHAFFGKVTRPYDFSEELLEESRNRLAELLYAIAGLAIQRIQERTDKQRDWSWTERLGIVVRTLAREAPRVWSYRTGRSSTIVVEVRYHTLLQALLDEFALDPEVLDKTLRREHEQLGDRPFVMRVVQWQRKQDDDAEAADVADPAAWDREAAAAKPFTQVHLIAVGVTRPEDERFPTWPTARADAHALSEAFASKKLVLAGNGVEPTDWGLVARRPARTTLLMDDQATRKRIYEAASEALARHQHVVVLFAGHTLTHEGEVWLVPVDGSRDDVARTCVSLDALSALALSHRDELDESLQKTPIGAWIAEGRVETLEASPHASEREVPTRGRELWVRMHAARPDTTAVADELRGHGLFTYFLVRALRMPAAATEEEEADYNSDNDDDEVLSQQQRPRWRTTAELLELTGQRVEAVARSLGRRQVPTNHESNATLALLLPSPDNKE